MILTQSPCSRCASFCQMGGGAFRMPMNRLQCVTASGLKKYVADISLLFVVGSGWLLEITSICWNQWDYKLNGCSIRWGSCYSWWVMFPSETTINFPFVSATGSGSSRVVAGLSPKWNVKFLWFINAYHHFSDVFDAGDLVESWQSAMVDSTCLLLHIVLYIYT